VTSLLFDLSNKLSERFEFVSSSSLVGIRIRTQNIKFGTDFLKFVIIRCIPFETHEQLTDVVLLQPVPWKMRLEMLN